VGAATRRDFQNASGVVLVESWAVSGMNHGTPVDPPLCGMAGAFILDVNLCAARLASEVLGLNDGGFPPPVDGTSFVHRCALRRSGGPCRRTRHPPEGPSQVPRSSTDRTEAPRDHSPLPGSVVMTTLEVRDLEVEAGGRTVVEGLSFSLRAGDKVGVVGRNVGKSGARDRSLVR